MFSAGWAGAEPVSLAFSGLSALHAGALQNQSPQSNTMGGRLPHNVDTVFSLFQFWIVYILGLKSLSLHCKSYLSKDKVPCWNVCLFMLIVWLQSPLLALVSNNLLSSYHLCHRRSEEQEEIWEGEERKKKVPGLNSYAAVPVQAHGSVLYIPAHRLGQFAAGQRDASSCRSTGAGQATARRSQGAGGGGSGGTGVGCGLDRLPQSQWWRGSRSSQLTGRRN